MQDTKIFSNYLASKIAAFNFDKYYTKKNRILLHVFMWLSFSILLILSYVLAYQLSYFEAFILTVRMTTVNMIVFYMFFYLLLPKIFSGGKARMLILLLFTFIISIFVWMAVTYFFSLLYHSLGFEIGKGELKGAIGMSASQTFLQAISVRRMFSQAFIIISILSPFFFVKILFEISKLYNKTLNIQSQKAALEIQNINIEKNFLKAQLNPHFLFNTLNNLYGLSIKKDDSTPEVILNLSDIMSYTLYESNTEKVALEKELDFIKNYFELEKMRYSAHKNIQFHIPEGEDLSGLYIAPLLTFTFIENAFKYGLKGNQKQFIHLEIKVQDRKFYFELENDVEQGIHDNEFGGIGITNARKRLQLLYPNKHQLDIENLETKFKVNLKIDLD
ncbi:sensor histidine kinase [Flavobacterium sp. LS1R47]|uniref:Sensor histidine kinase n=1 Tax=Flavobacterium frigoritolerans TaxID=2987686 RepID=A0A9X3C9J0_9FLAO|nr:sensor histidine kinase [Flavobacterium frigoritolerans]MCV9934077.1 sensor histidine kinase [Flavobacterium frigoritolerans]